MNSDKESPCSSEFGHLNEAPPQNVPEGGKGAPWLFGRGIFSSSVGRSRALIVTAVVAQAAQLCALVSLRHPLWFSNFTQVLLPMVAFLLCLSRRIELKEHRRRAAWTKLAAALALWTMGQITYLVEIYIIPSSAGFNWLDDVLWLLFALPFLLLTCERSENQINWVSLLDHCQGFVFFGILLASVFCSPHTLPFNTAYNFLNLTVLLSCLLHLASVEDGETFRFYGRFGLYLCVFCFCAGVGNHLQSRGMAPGSLVDLFWTAPTTVFCLLVRNGESSKAIRQRHQPWAKSLARLIRGVSALGLATLSIGASAAVLTGHPILGYISLVGSFALFALRTIVREIQSYRASDRLEISAFRDPLTGLGNRAHFRGAVAQSIDEAAARGMKVALLFVDLDRFKAVNDELGHAAGDKLLVEIATRLQHGSRKGEAVCRLGGDEFVIAMIVQEESVARGRAETLLGAISTPFQIEGRELHITGSIGVVLGETHENQGDLLRRADDAMYGAKKLGKNRVQVYDHAFVADRRSEWLLEQDLEQSLAQRAIQVAFQPIYSLAVGEIVGFEALARWVHPQRGIVAPAIFIPLAEETGLIRELGAQVLITACQEVARLNTNLETNLFVSVNVSSKQFSNGSLLELTRVALEGSGLRPSNLHLEITESVLLHNDPAVERTLVEARSLGIGISLDDFGTGYSSLSYLLNLPVDEIKIDRSFVCDLDLDPRRVELVRAVVNLGQTMGKRVVAEGVESQAQLEILHDLKCGFIQGYLISEPLPPTSLADLIRRGYSDPSETNELIRANRVPNPAERQNK